MFSWIKRHIKQTMKMLYVIFKMAESKGESMDLYVTITFSLNRPMIIKKLIYLLIYSMKSCPWLMD